MAKKQQSQAVDARHFDVIVAPHITEKSTLLSEQNAVVFKVAKDASKPEIKAAVEALFDVKVVEVRTASVKSKPKRRGMTAGRSRSWKKAIVQVRPGDTIPIFQGLQGLEG